MTTSCPSPVHETDQGTPMATRRTGVNDILSVAVFARAEGTVIDDEATDP